MLKYTEIFLKGSDTKMKRYLTIILCFCLISFCLTGCFGKLKLDDYFNEDEMLELAYTVINEVHVNGVESVIKSRMRSDYLESYPMDEMVEDFENLRVGLGTFMDYTQTTIIAKESPDDKKEALAVAAVTATYEKGELIFMLSFDTDKNLVGFYMKK